MIWRLTVPIALIFLLWAGSVAAQPRAYIPNTNAGTVIVIDVSSNTVIDTINVGARPVSTAVTPDGTKVYVPRNVNPGRVEVIQTSTNTVINTVNVGNSASDVAITPDGSFAYVTNFNSFNVSVIDTSTDMVVTTIPLGSVNPGRVLVSPDGANVYVLITSTNQRLIRIDTSSNTVVGPALTGFGNGNSMDITPDGSKIYITVLQAGIGVADFVQVVDIAMDGTPSLGTTVSLQFGNCELRPNHIAVHPDGTEAWVVTTPSDFGVTCGPMDPFNAEFLIINTTTDVGTPIGGLPTFSRLGFTRDGATAVFTTFMNSSVTAPAMFPLVLGMQTVIGPAFPQSPYFIGPDTSQLTVTKTGDGDGTVTSMNPAGMDCGDICDITVTTGMVVTLTAVEDAQSDFTGWGGDCSGMGDQTMITVSEDSECTAEFTRVVFDLNLTIAGNGTGTVTLDPPDEACEPNCTQTYMLNDVVTLTPNPGMFSNFDGITGAGCSTNITITSDLNCTATFTLMQFLLSVTTSGTGDGTVTAPARPGGSPDLIKRGPGGGINCGEGNTDCEELYDATTMVTLTAAPDAESDFTGWTGACAPAGTNTNATVNMTSALSCNAEFTLKTFDVTVIIGGTGGGTVSSAPPGINCPGDCSETYDIHTAISLTGTPDPVSMPAVWSENCPGGVIADLTEDTVCTATFNFLPLELSDIFPAVQGNPNFMNASNASPNGIVAFVWGFSLGTFNVAIGCGAVELGIAPFQVLGFATAGANQIANFVFFIVQGTYANPTYTQAVDMDTCRKSDVIFNIISNK